MSSFRPILLLLSLSLLLYSCEKVLDVDESAIPKEVVVNAMPITGQQLFVNVSYSRFLLDPSNQHPVPSADIALSVNGNVLYPHHTQGCNYFFDYIAQPDDTIALSLFADGKHITAQTYTPRMPRITNVSARVDKSKTFTLGNVYLTFNDYPNYPEYYHITVSRRDSGVVYRPSRHLFDTVDTIRSTYFFFFDPKLTDPSVLYSGSLANMLYTKIMALGTLIDGQTHTAPISILMLTDTNEVQPFLHRYRILFESVTPARFNYILFLGANGNSSLLSEPAQMYSNINGGAYGIFAGSARREFWVDFDTNGNGTVTPITPPAAPAPCRQ